MLRSPARAPVQEGIEDPWPARWEELSRLQSLEDSLLRQDLSELQRKLARDLEAKSGSASAGPVTPERFRIALLGAALGQAPSDWASIGLPDGLTRGERALALPYLPPGQARTKALVMALEDPEALAKGDAGTLLARQTLTFEAFREDIAAFRSDSALDLARALQASAQEIWSAFCLEGILRRRGDTQGAIEVLQEQLARTPAEQVAQTIELLERLAIAAAGAGDSRLEQGKLGRAARLGGDDALQILGKSALLGDRPQRARRLFGALLDRARIGDKKEAPWALRGWGLSLLPSRMMLTESIPAEAQAPSPPPESGPVR